MTPITAVGLPHSTYITEMILELFNVVSWGPFLWSGDLVDNRVAQYIFTHVTEQLTLRTYFNRRDWIGTSHDNAQNIGTEGFRKAISQVFKL